MRDSDARLILVDVGAANAGSQVRTSVTALLVVHESEAPFRFAVGGSRDTEVKGIYRSEGGFGENV